MNLGAQQKFVSRPVLDVLLVLRMINVRIVISERHDEADEAQGMNGSRLTNHYRAIYLQACRR